MTALVVLRFELNRSSFDNTGVTKDAHHVAHVMDVTAIGDVTNGDIGHSKVLWVQPGVQYRVAQDACGSG